MTGGTDDGAKLETGDECLTVRRTFDASRDRVFDAWTDPEQVAAWWGPNGFAIETDEIEIRPGGVWRFAMIGPDEEAYPNLVTFEEVEEPRRLAYAHGEPGDPEQFRVTVTFEDGEGGETTDLTMEMRFPSSEDLDEAIEFGAGAGAKETLASLAEHLGATGDDGTTSGGDPR